MTTSLREIHRLAFSHLRLTDDDFARLSRSSPVESRPGRVSIEILVRYDRIGRNPSGPAWRPLNAPMGKQVLVDAYHPDAMKWDKSHNKAEAMDTV